MANSILPTLPDSPASSGIMVIMLALNLIILAFFILLNALSTPAETRQAAAIYGLQSGFDARSNAGKTGDDHTTQIGPAWVAPLEGQVNGLVRQAWPGATLTMDAEMGVIEVSMALPDVWGEGAFDARFVAMVENLLAILKETPEAAVVAVAESLPRDDAAAMFAAAADQLPGLPFGWVPLAKADEMHRAGLLKLVISGAKAVPEEARMKAENVLRRSGAGVERLAE